MKGAFCTFYADGKSLVDAFENVQPGECDAILMDVQMPCMNGIEATREIRHTDRPDAETIPIIAMTANAFRDDKEATKEAGMNAHLSKPINIGQIVTVVCREVSKNKKE